MKTFTLILILLLSNDIICQSKNSRILSYAELYGSVRFFYPNTITEEEWWNFLSYGINEIEKEHKNELHLFNSLFLPVCPQIKFSNDNSINTFNNDIHDPIYWQHRSHGDKSGEYYKSVIINYDSIDILYNGINYNKKIESKNDSIEVAIKFTNLTDPTLINFHLSLYSLGWVNGVQNENKGKLRYDPLRKVYYLRLNAKTENIYFTFFLETKPLTNVVIDELYVLKYKKNTVDTVLKEEFKQSIIDENIELGEHHSTSIKLISNGLKITSNNERYFQQVFKDDYTKLGSANSELNNGLFFSFPLVINRESLKAIVDFSIYKKYSTTDYSTLAKVGLIETYSRMIHFNPNLRFINADINQKLLNCYSEAEKCQSLSEADNILRSFMTIFKDGHSYVYNPNTPKNRKCIKVNLKCKKNKCFISHSQDSLFTKGDRILSINNVTIKNLLIKERNESTKSDNQKKENAGKYFLCLDSSITNTIIYKRGLKKMYYTEEINNLYLPYPKSYDSIVELRNNIYLINLSKCSINSIKKLTKEKNIKGIIMDARNGIRVQSSLLSLFSKKDLSFPLVHVPLFIKPKQESMRTEILNTKEVVIGKLEKEADNIPIVLLISGRNISSEETFISMAKQIDNIKFVGKPTAGCNGMVNEFKSPGGFEYRYTAAIVNKSDGSRLYNVGFIPDKVIKLKKSHIKKGVDTALEVAIKLLND